MVGTNPKTRQQEEIDIIGSADKNTALLLNVSGVMKVLTSVFLKHLLNAVNFLISTKAFLYFSKSGFTKGCIDKANELENVSLIAYDDILKYNNEN